MTEGLTCRQQFTVQTFMIMYLYDLIDWGDIFPVNVTWFGCRDNHVISFASSGLRNIIGLIGPTQCLHDLVFCGRSDMSWCPLPLQSLQEQKEDSKNGATKENYERSSGVCKVQVCEGIVLTRCLSAPPVSSHSIQQTTVTQPGKSVIN